MDMRRLVWWLAPLYSGVVSAWLLLVPSFATASSTATLVEGQRPRPISGMQVSVSLFEVQGWWVLIPLVIPVVLAALPLAGGTPRARRGLGIIACALLVAFSVVAGFSIGYYYLPAAAVLIGAMLLVGRPGAHVPRAP